MMALSFLAGFVACYLGAGALIFHYAWRRARAEGLSITWGDAVVGLCWPMIFLSGAGQ